jgi:hypothetical protein
MITATIVVEIYNARTGASIRAWRYTATLDGENYTADDASIDARSDALRECGQDEDASVRTVEVTR